MTETETETIPAWAAEPLRPGEHDVPVMFRVTATDEAAARAKVRRITDAECVGHIVPMYMPEPLDPSQNTAAAALTQRVGNYPR